MHHYTLVTLVFNWLGAQVSLAWESGRLPWNRKKKSFKLPGDTVLSSYRLTNHFLTRSWNQYFPPNKRVTCAFLPYFCFPPSISVRYQLEAETIPSIYHFTSTGIQLKKKKKKTQQDLCWSKVLKSYNTHANILICCLLILRSMFVCFFTYLVLYSPRHLCI